MSKRSPTKSVITDSSVPWNSKQSFVKTTKIHIAKNRMNRRYMLYYNNYHYTVCLDGLSPNEHRRLHNKDTSALLIQAEVS